MEDEWRAVCGTVFLYVISISIANLYLWVHQSQKGTYLYIQICVFETNTAPFNSSHNSTTVTLSSVIILSCDFESEKSKEWTLPNQNENTAFSKSLELTESYKSLGRGTTVTGISEKVCLHQWVRQRMCFWLGKLLVLSCWQTVLELYVCFWQSDEKTEKENSLRKTNTFPKGRVYNAVGECGELLGVIQFKMSTMCSVSKLNLLCVFCLAGGKSWSGWVDILIKIYFLTHDLINNQIRQRLCWWTATCCCRIINLVILFAEIEHLFFSK